MDIRRGFVEVREGQIHYRSCGGLAGDRLPLVMLHASPGSSKSLELLIKQLGGSRRVIAPDTLGNGDSSPPTPETPEIGSFSEGVVQLLDGLRLERIDLYGTHTGANIAMEVAISHPSRVRRMILDGVPFFTEADRQERLAYHAPRVQPSEDGAHLAWAWHFTRDRFLFSPWYRRDRAHRRDVEFPSAEALHEMTVDVLKALRTYHLSYNAVFRYHSEERLPLIAVPTMVAAAPTDQLFPHLDRAASLLPGCVKVAIPGISSVSAVAETSTIFLGFLES